MVFKRFRNSIFPLRLYASVLFVVALLLLAGGGYLVVLGGSAYYALAGATTFVAGIYLWRARLEGALIYALMLLLTVPWAIWEAGLDAWALMPRLVAPVVLGLPLLFPAVRRKMSNLGWSRHLSQTATVLGAVGCSIALSAAAFTARPADPIDPIFQAGFFADGLPTPSGVPASPQDGEWLHYGNDAGGSRFSRLSEITPSNVAALKPAWVFRVGKTYGLETTPLKVDRSLYLCTAYNDVIALDAETGGQIWRWKANLDMKQVPYSVCRGVAYFKTPEATGPCAERIITNTTDARLVALDARSGRLCPAFGKGGQVNLLEGLVQKFPGIYSVTSAPTIVQGKVVLGGWVSDGQYWGEPAGVVRAFDAITGKLVWAFDAGRPDRKVLAPGETYTHSTPNAWAPFSADEALGLVYVPLGNPAVDYYGGHRRAFDEKYGSSVIAIDATSGDVRWTFQAVHHDLWDWDTASQPTLVDVPYRGKLRQALIQPTKRGEVFVLDRVTGKPLLPVKELPVPQGGLVPGERLSPTQPFSIGMPSFRGPDFTERFMWGITPLDQLWCRIRFKEARYEGTATPPGLKPNIAYPGFNGGIDWGGVSVDPERKILFVNSNRVANYNRLYTREGAARAGISFSKMHVGAAVPQENTPYVADVRIFMSPLGIPCNQPPYGKIAAVDLQTGKLIWENSFGNARASGPWGIRSMLPIPVGTPNNGGTLATRSGLLFVGATHDGDFRAFEASTGKLLWQDRLPAGGQATPMTYVSPQSGRQFVVIAAGGHPALKSVLGDYIIAYALPKAR